jgi:hypothetical protein
MVRGELLRLARCCHISRLFHNTKAKKNAVLALVSGGRTLS